MHHAPPFPPRQATSRWSWAPASTCPPVRQYRVSARASSQLDDAPRGSLLATLRERGLLADIAGDAEAFASAAARGPLRIYCGVDPTAESLHVGNLLCLMVFGWCRRLGHIPVCLLGGATGRVGDPSGALHGEDIE